ncbi:MAG: AraC family transcriptional regulator [Acidobacteriota bacterium]|nr:AraC family transcriptional regulator [Acidobacteriota bacterium]MDQ3489036.1 AraC family transcriptional regulator [Acidobacteriota bacterium]
MSDTVVSEAVRVFPRSHEASVGRGTGAVESRARVLDLDVGYVENVQRSDARADAGPQGYCSDFQICLPYRGIFVWHVEKDDVVGDPNQIVFVRAGEPYRMSSPSDEGYAELIITPDLDILAELAHPDGGGLFQHPLFSRRTLRAGPHVQALRSRLIHRAITGSLRDCLEAEEMTLAVLRVALQQDVSRLRPITAATARLLRRTKEVLEARLPERLRLTEIAQAVHVSPAYLTDLFTRTEGVSLHQYLTQLRLSRALLELPSASDLTALALELGFSSHSHFTFAFRRTFGCTPSAYRERTRRDIGLPLRRGRR